MSNQDFISYPRNEKEHRTLKKIFNSLYAIRHKPELIRLLTDYVEIVEKDSRGELTQEQKVIYDRLNEYINLNHELRCKKPSQKRRETITQRINEITAIH